jgi:predicted DNA-binding transcriptional regulator AlpA
MATLLSPELQLVGISDAEQLTGYERSTIWRRCRAGTFPPPSYIGNRRVWKLSDLRAWLDAEMARPSEERRGAANLAGK